MSYTECILIVPSNMFKRLLYIPHNFIVYFRGGNGNKGMNFLTSFLLALRLLRMKPYIWGFKY